MSATWRFSLSALGVSLLCAVGVSLRWPAWFINSPALIDAWIYWGTAANVEYASTYFSDTYYFRRWTLTGPAWLAQQLFDPFVAQAVHRGIALTLVLFLGSWIVYVVTRSTSIALITPLFLGSCTFIIQNVGTSYHQGEGLIFFLGSTLAGLLISQSRRPLLTVFASSFLAGLFLITYQIALYFIPGLIVLALIQFADQLKLTALLSRRSGAIAKALLVFVLGLLFATIVDQVLGRAFGFDWTNQFALMYRSRNLSDGFMPDPPIGFLDLLLQGRYFVLFASMALFCLLTLLVISGMLGAKVGGFRKELGLVGMTLTTGSIYFLGSLMALHNMSVWPWKNIYVFVLAIIVMLVASGTLLRIPKVSTRFNYGFMLALALAWFLGLSGLFLFWTLENSEIVIRVAALIALCLAATALFISKFGNVGEQQLAYPTKTYLGLALAGVAVVGALSTTHNVNKVGFPFQTNTAAIAFMEAVSQQHDQITDKALSVGLRVWLLDLREPDYGWGPNVSALYGLYSALAVGKPRELPSCGHLEWIMGSPHAIVVLGPESEDQAARSVSDLVQDCKSDLDPLIRTDLSIQGETWIQLEPVEYLDTMR